MAALALVRDRYLQLAGDPQYIRAVLQAGADRARELASGKVQMAKTVCPERAPGRI